MPDIFDQVAAAPAPAGDVFDQVAAGPAKGDVFDQAAADLSRVKLDPAQRAEYESMAGGRGKPEDGEGNTTDFLTAVGRSPGGFLRSLPGSAAAVVEDVGAKVLNAIPAAHRAVTGTDMSGNIPTRGVVTRDAQGREQLTNEEEPLPFQPGEGILPSDATPLNPEGSDANRLVRGLTTPGMAITAPFAALKPVQAYFLTQTGAGAAEAASRALDPSLSADERRSAVQDAILNGAMALGVAGHLAKGRPDVSTAPASEPVPAETSTVPPSPEARTTAPVAPPASLPEPKTDVFDQVADGPAAIRLDPNQPVKLPEGHDVHVLPDGGLYAYDPDRISPEEINKTLGMKTEDAVEPKEEEVSSNAATKEPEQTSVPPQREGGDEGGTAAEASGGDSVQRAAPGEAGQPLPQPPAGSAPESSAVTEPAAETPPAAAAPKLDPVETFLQKGIDATSLKQGELFEGITGAPVWMGKSMVNLSLKMALQAYRTGRDIVRAVDHGLAWLRAQQIPGYDEGQAREWMQQVLKATAAGKEDGRVFGGATNDRRPIEQTRPDDWANVDAPTTEPWLSDLHSAVTGAGWRQRAEGFRAWLGGMAGETFPRTTRAARAVGEQMARWISSRTAAVPLADGLVDDVTRGLDIDDVKFGAMLHEDNLRSIQQRLLKQADSLQKKDPNKAFELRQQAQNVFTFVGKDGVFKDENEYQNYLNHPRVQEAIRRYKDLRGRLIEPMYQEAMKLDPALQLEPRGLQTGARINLNWVNPGELAGRDVYVANPTPRGKLSNVLQKRSPFGRVATGNAVAYRPSFRDSIRNTYARQLEIANRNKFDRLLVQSGNAVLGKPGARVTVKGEKGVPFEIRRQMLTQLENGNITRIPLNQNIYVRESLAGEYGRALNLDRPAGDGMKVVRALNKFSNTAAISGLTDVSAHVSNLSHALFTRPGITQNFWREIGLSALGRADIPLAIARAMRRFSDTDQARLRELAQIGALREPHPPGAKWNPMRFGAELIQHLDTRTRLQLDRMYSNLADQGLVDRSETARREFINQVGQYNKRAQGPMMRWFRDTGLGPFATAGRAFNTLGVRTATLNPGVAATGAGARLALAATMASKIAGTALLIGTANYLLTRDKGGGVMGRPGVRIGTIDLGVNDKNGRPLTLDLANILGLGRAMRVTGARGALESVRNNLPIGTALDSSYRDIVNSWISPFAGPTIRAATIAATGQQPAIKVPPVAPVVPPGQSQAVQNIKTAAVEMSPVVAGIHDSLQPGSTGWEWLQKQAGRFTLQPGKAPALMSRYPYYVERAQMDAYLDDVIHRARSMPPEAKIPYVRGAVMNVPARDRQAALQKLEMRGIIPKQ